MSSFLASLGLGALSVAPQQQGRGLGMLCRDWHGGLWAVVLVWLWGGGMGDWGGLAAT